MTKTHGIKRSTELGFVEPVWVLSTWHCIISFVTLGGTFNLPHAETHVAILPHVVAYNTPYV
jgi:hypothetical protein